jgi:hypothetical protein
MTTNLLWAWSLVFYVLFGPEGFFSSYVMVSCLLWVLVWRKYSWRQFLEYCFYSMLPILFEVCVLAFVGFVHDRDYRQYLQIFLGFAAAVSIALIIISSRNIGVRFPGMVIILVQIYSTILALYVAGMRINDSWL